jgi:hypothetical protein
MLINSIMSVRINTDESTHPNHSVASLNDQTRLKIAHQLADSFDLLQITSPFLCKDLELLIDLQIAWLCD